jgi:hypothetical protein
LGGRSSLCLFSSDATRKERKSATMALISKFSFFDGRGIFFSCSDIVLRAPE